MPHVGHRQADEFGECARAVYSDSLRVRTQVPPSSQAVAAKTPDHVAFSADDVAWKAVFDVRSRFDHPAHKFVPDRHRYWNRLLCPLVPVIDVNIGAANARAQHTDENVIDADLGLFDGFKPQTWLAPALDQCFHHTLP